MSGRTYVFAGGGTGGHLFPGIAVAECLVQRRSDARILFVGSERKIERDVLASTPFEHRSLPASSSASARRRPLQFAANLWQSYRSAMRLMKEVRPDAVIGCGGFASAAPVVAARKQRVPVLLLEQNVIPGRSTRWLSRLGGIVCLTYEQSALYLRKSTETVVTGNPVRPEIAELVGEPQSRNGRTLLVLGGSQGARSLNELLLSVAEHHRSLLDDWHIIHQTGPSDEERVRTAYDTLSLNATVSAFFANPADLYRQADLAVSRAGGTTLSELACAGLPALLLPYPHAADNHQWHNAELFRRAGAAHILDQTTDHAGIVPRFANELDVLMSDPAVRQLMSTAMSSLARPDAATNIANLIDQI